MKMRLGALAATVWLGVNFAASGAVAQTEGPGRTLVVSPNLRLSADLPRSGNMTTGFKEFIVPYGGIVRVRWQLRSDDMGMSANVTVRSLIDVCAASTTSTAFVNQSCTLRVVAGDKIQVSASGTFQINELPPNNYSDVTIRNVRIFYDVQNATGNGTVLSN